MNQLGKKLRYRLRNCSSIASLKRSNCNTSIFNNKVGSVSSNDSSDKSEMLRVINQIPMSPIKSRKEISSPNLNDEQSNFLSLCTFYKSDNFVRFEDHPKSHHKNSSMTPVQKRGSSMISEGSGEEEEVKSCSKFKIQKQKELAKDLSSTSSDSSKLNYEKKHHVAPKNKISLNLIPDGNQRTYSKNSPHIMKIKKVKKVKKRKTTKQLSSKRINSCEISQDVLSGLNSILQELESVDQVSNSNENNVTLNSSLAAICTEGGSFVNSPETQSGKKARNSSKTKRKSKCKVQQKPKLNISHHKLQSMYNLELIMESLGQVIEEDEKLYEKSSEASNQIISTTRSKFSKKAESFNDLACESFKKFMK